MHERAKNEGKSQEWRKEPRMKERAKNELKSKEWIKDQRMKERAKNEWKSKEWIKDQRMKELAAKHIFQNPFNRTWQMNKPFFFKSSDQTTTIECLGETFITLTMEFNFMQRYMIHHVQFKIMYALEYQLDVTAEASSISQDYLGVSASVLS